jgi:hypothetical protein
MRKQEGRAHSREMEGEDKKFARCLGDQPMIATQSCCRTGDTDGMCLPIGKMNTGAKG